MRSHALDTARTDAGLVVLDHEHGARARPWGTLPGTAHLVIADHTLAPPLDRVVAWTEELRHRGFERIRTGALAEAPAAVFAAAGFDVEQELVLLRADPRDRLHLGNEGSQPIRLVQRPRTARSDADLARAADIDRAAFGDRWCIDTTGIVDACTATPSGRLRLVGVQGYAVTGRAGQGGFLQRLAVHPDHQRQGVARRLVVDSLEWLRRWRVHTAMVNTHVGNTAALDLYASVGFTRLDQDLVVMGRSLAGGTQR